MCRIIQHSIKYTQCTKEPKHVITTNTTDTEGCDEFHKTGLKCDDGASLAKGKNGMPIQLGSTTRPGACPKCLS